MTVNFEHSDRVKELIARLESFMAAEVYPHEAEHHRWVSEPANLWIPWPRGEQIKARAQGAGLWNLFLPHEYGAISPGLTNLEYAPLAELMGRVRWASEMFNCSAPDTGNMEVLAKFGTPAQRKCWLAPLLDGEIRSAYAMTEPDVASSDATNLRTSITRERDDYVINGRRWLISGAMDPRCKVLLVMGKTNFDAPKHLQHSMIIVPRDAPGLSVVRAISIFNSHHSPGGEAELLFENVRVPADNLILGEGRGFEIAQGRLGPGRIHHCMRSIGQAQRALELMARRADERVAFGKKLAALGGVRQDIARSYCEIEMARLLTLKAADAMDRVGNKMARDLIAAIKCVAPRMAQTVIDRAIQIHGGLGVTDDTPIAAFFTVNRFLRLADGPDEVHLEQLGKLKIAEYSDALAVRPDG
jgi:acyl-CoA dehydrogenase